MRENEKKMGKERKEGGEDRGRGQQGRQKRARLHEESPVQEERAERGSYK